MDVFPASLPAGLFTAIGALPVLSGRLVAQRSIDVLLGFAAAIMLAASLLSLIIPGIASACAIYCGARLAALIAVGLCARGGASKSRS